MKQIAIIGKYGVGKTTLLERIAALGYKTLNADNFFKTCYLVNQPCYKAIKAAFGPNFVNDKEVDRNAIRQMLNNDMSQIDLLEKTVHPILEKEVAKKIYHFVEIPIIYSKNVNFLAHFDLIIELRAGDQKRSQNIKNKNVEKSISSLNNALNKGLSNDKNVIIDGDKLQKDQDLKDFLKTLI